VPHNGSLSKKDVFKNVIKDVIKDVFIRLQRLNKVNGDHARCEAEGAGLRAQGSGLREKEYNNFTDTGL